MADRKKARPKRKDRRGDDEKLTKQENAIARHLRFTCPTKTTMLSGDEVHYFTGSKAVETLLESKWGKKAKKDPIFTNPQSVVNYMNILMAKGLFWRARKLVPKRKERPGGEKDGSENKGTENDSPNIHKKDQKQRHKDKKAAKEKEKESERDEDAPAEDKDKRNDEDKDGNKKKRKIKLDYHADQVFVNSNDVYVWVFDPTPWTKFLIGLALVLGSIGICLFPLWPPWVRLAIYYLSLVAMAFVGALLGLALFRTILFGVIWTCTMGVHHFWLLPNLTEDCGFFDSFKPLYSYKHCPKDQKKSAEKEKKSDDEKADSTDENDEQKEDTKADAAEGEDKNSSDSEASGSEGSQRKSDSGEKEMALKQRRHKVQTQKSQECDFEMINDQ